MLVTDKGCHCIRNGCELVQTSREITREALLLLFLLLQTRYSTPQCAAPSIASQSPTVTTTQTGQRLLISCTGSSIQSLRFSSIADCDTHYTTAPPWPWLPSQSTPPLPRQRTLAHEPHRPSRIGSSCNNARLPVH
jgi:hypothetical protein